MDFGFTILFVELLIIFVRNCSTCCQSFPNANNPTTVSTTFNSPFIVDSRLSDCMWPTVILVVEFSLHRYGKKLEGGFQDCFSLLDLIDVIRITGLPWFHNARGCLQTIFCPLLTFFMKFLSCDREMCRAKYSLTYLVLSTLFVNTPLP